MNLEDKLLGKLHSAQEIDEEELLLVLGANEDKVPEYKAKLDLLEAEFEDYMEQNNIPYYDAKKLAEGLKDFLWKDKKERYNGNFLLPDVIDAQLSEVQEKVGSCVGLTALYWVLGSRLGLRQSVLLHPRHIYSRIILNDDSSRTLLDLENTRPSGKINFDYYFDAKEFGIEGLVSATLLNRSHKKKEEGNLFGALDDLTKNLGFEALKDQTYYSMSILKFDSGFYGEALKDINKALELDIQKDYFHAFKGEILMELKKYNEALECFEKAMALNKQDYEENNKDEENVHYLLGAIRAKKELKMYEEAIKDYNWLMLIDDKNKPDYLLERGKLKSQLGLKDIDEAIKLKPKLEEHFLK